MRHSRLERRGKNLALPIIGQLQMRKKVLKSAHWASRLDLDAFEAETSKRHKSKRPYSFLRLFFHPRGRKIASREKSVCKLLHTPGKNSEAAGKKPRRSAVDSNVANCAHTHAHDEYVNLCFDACATSSSVRLQPEPPHFFPVRCMLLMCT